MGKVGMARRASGQEPRSGEVRVSPMRSSRVDNSETGLRDSVGSIFEPTISFYYPIPFKDACHDGMMTDDDIMLLKDTQSISPIPANYPLSQCLAPNDGAYPV